MEKNSRKFGSLNEIWYYGFNFKNNDKDKNILENQASVFQISVGPVQ